MADYKKLSAELKVIVKRFDPDGTALVDVQGSSWIDMRDYSHVLCIFHRQVGTSNVAFKLLSNPQANGGGTDTVEKTHAVGAQPDAEDDVLVLELNAAEMTNRYLSAQASFATGTDEGTVVYILTPRFPRKDLTADAVA